MRYDIDREYLLGVFQKIVNTPSPVGCYSFLNPVLQELASELDLSVTVDNRGAAYIYLDGEDCSKTVLIGAHADTLGMVVRKIEPDGMIRVTALGGIHYGCLEGETVTIHTQDGKNYTGLFMCQSHSVHAFEDARTLERNEKTMMILLDEKIRSRDDVLKLGIRHGDFVSVDPRCQITPNGFVKSRYIDDKGAIACCFAMLKYFSVHGLKPKYRTVFAFPYTEEIGFGGSYIPANVSEFVAMDIGLISPDYESNEFAVTICPKDGVMPYDPVLTRRLIECAEKADCDYAVDVFGRLGTDASTALRAGYDIKTALFGMAVYGSHNMERTHILGLCNATNLLIAYLLDI